MEELMINFQYWSWHSNSCFFKCSFSMIVFTGKMCDDAFKEITFYNWNFYRILYDIRRTLYWTTPVKSLTFSIHNCPSISAKSLSLPLLTGWRPHIWIFSFLVVTKISPSFLEYLFKEFNFVGTIGFGLKICWGLIYICKNCLYQIKLCILFGETSGFKSYGKFSIFVIFMFVKLTYSLQ